MRLLVAPDCALCICGIETSSSHCLPVGAFIFYGLWHGSHSFSSSELSCTFHFPQSIAVALLLGLPFSLIFPLYNIKMMTCESGEHCQRDTKKKTQQTNNRQSSSIALVTHTVLFSCGKQTRGDSFFVLSYLFSADINYYLKRAVANKSANNSAFYSSQFATATSSSPTLSCTLSCLCLLQQINIFRYSCVSRIN